MKVPKTKDELTINNLLDLLDLLDEFLIQFEIKSIRLSTFTPTPTPIPGLYDAPKSSVPQGYRADREYCIIINNNVYPEIETLQDYVEYFKKEFLSIIEREEEYDYILWRTFPYFIKSSDFYTGKDASAIICRFSFIRKNGTSGETKKEKKNDI